MFHRLTITLFGFLFLSSTLMAQGKNLAYLGVLLEDQKGGGLLVNGVVTDSPAEGAGIKQNDILLKLNGKPVGPLADFVKRLRTFQPGDKITFQLRRSGKEISVKTTLISVASIIEIRIIQLGAKEAASKGLIEIYKKKEEEAKESTSAVERAKADEWAKKRAMEEAELVLIRAELELQRKQLKRFSPK